MKTIVLLIDSLKGGGAERVTLTLATAFIEQGHIVTILMMQDIVAFEVDKRITVECLDFKKGAVSSFSYHKYAQKLKEKLHSITQHSGNIDFVGGSLGLTHRLMHLAKLEKAYYFLHGSTSVAKIGNRQGLKRYMKTRKVLSLYNEKDLICVSKGVEKDILDLGVKPSSIHTIYNPYDFNAIAKLAEEKIDFQIPKEQYIVHVGRFSRLKRHDILLHAFLQLKDTSLKLLLVGKGEEEENIRALCQELGINDRVVFTGFQSNPYPIIKNAELLVLSSDHEGLPTVLIEALSLGTQVVSTDCPSGPHEILSPELEEYLSPVGDSKALSVVIEKALSDRYEIPKAVLEPFEQKRVLEQYEKLF